MVRLGVTVGAWIVTIAAGAALASYVLGGTGRGGFTQRLPRLPRVGAAAEPDPDAGPDPADSTVELTLEDLRPSQPAPPAIDWSPPPVWDDSTPYVSSIDGVEVDPRPPAAPSSDRPARDRPLDDPERGGDARR
ncbi:MAG: hypothetical protein R2695_21365 [Acidimicrobiales bacterium]